MTKDNKHSLTDSDKLILKFIDKAKRNRSWIRNIMLKAFLEKKIPRWVSISEADYSLHKLTRLGLIKSEKWTECNMRVYYK